MQTIHFPAAVSAVLDNARRLGTPAQAVAPALDLTCPQPEAEWKAICPWCLGEAGDYVLVATVSL